VRITADCPLIDPTLIDQTVALLNQNNSQQTDFACNRLPPPFSRSFPIGLDVEVCTFAALERAWRESTEIFHREHVMPYLYEAVPVLARDEAAQMAQLVSRGSSPRGFNIAVLNHDPDLGTLRWTVDTPEDLTFMQEIFSRLSDKAQFTWYDVLRIVQNEPHLSQINAAVLHKSMTDVDHRAQSK
jgi:spore coat polysaccharide biosynthesis protein SpsF